MDSPLQPVLSILAVVCALLIARNAFRQHKKLPPGPRGNLLTGNARQVPKEKPWVTFAEWSKQYGDLIFLNVYGQNWLVLNSYQSTMELLEKRGSIYSNRPVSRMRQIASLQKDERSMMFMQYADRLRSSRKLFHKVMGTVATFRRYDDILEEECRRFLKVMLSNPEEYRNHLKHFTASVLLRITYGYQTQDHPDPWVQLATNSMRIFAELFAPGRYLVELVPWLRYVPAWFPGGRFNAVAERYRSLLFQAVNQPFEWTLSRMQSEDFASFVSDNVNDAPDSDVQDQIKWASNAMYFAGSDTSTVAMHTFVLAMAKYPEVQARAQAEIDQVVGHDQLPSLKDLDNLPYFRAVVWEVLRWHAIVPLGLTHVSAQDDVYDGYFIPKGTHVMPNIWSMLHDPEVYHNPHEFDPTRFLKTKETDEVERDPCSVAFGFGRRLCPGRVMAEASVSIVSAMLLATFDITKDSNEELELDYISGVICQLKPFKCTVKPRSKTAIQLINQPLGK